MSEIDKLFEGPFTYDIGIELSLRYDEDDEIAVSAKDQPVIALMYALMKIYNSTAKKNYDEAERKILEVNELWSNLDMKRITTEKISTRVLKHIKDSTLYYFYLIIGNDVASAKIFEQITDSRELTSNTELATFYGCRALGWSSFHEAGHREALNHALQASCYCRDCPLWHFVLYKNYRISRRKLDFDTAPSSDEMSSILACVDLSTDPFYSLYAGQMYREAKDRNKALIMFDKVYEARPESSGVLLRLALGMLRCWQNDKAKELLDKVEKRYPNDLMFLHYKGLYLEIVKNYEAAAEYFARSARGNNYGADLAYATCRRKFDKDFDCLSHLQMMMAKYASQAHVEQQLLLHLAMNYFEKGDFTEACKSFLKAIEINRNSNQLKRFNNSTVNYEIVDIFDFIKLKLLPACDSVDPVVTQQLLDLCP